MKNPSRALAILGILLGTAVMEAGWSSINLSLASIQSELGATILQLQWMMDLYGICICTTLLPLGKLGDAQGRKPIYLAGLFGFALAYVGAGMASSPGVVIAFMGLSGLSAASILSLSQALIVYQFPENRKSSAVALWAITASTSVSLGPILGGFVIQHLNWRWAFLIYVPLVLIALMLVFFFVKSEAKTSSHCHWGEVLLFGIIIAGLVGAILQGPKWGWSSWEVMGLFSLFLLALIVFIVVERKSKEPLFHARLFAHRGFFFASICNSLLAGFVWAIFFFVPLYLQNERGVSSLETGIKMFFISVPVAAFSLTVGKLYRIIGAKPLLIIGFNVLFIAVFFQPVISFELSCLLIGLGWVLILSPAAALALSSLPHEMAGIASGMYLTIQEIGGGLVLAIAGATFRTSTNRYLMPNMEKIEAVLKDRTSSLISDPSAAEKFVSPCSPVLNWLHQGFEVGYQNVLFFLSFLMIVALVVAWFVPKSVYTR